ncbi:MAG: substrate-binding domain-containing protein [Oscillospiraceae bacterium]|nr:substrate-binding domain-containing protein [Oscillospiraceae bacterium]
MKKLLALVLALLMAFSLFACNTNSGKDSPVVSNSPSTGGAENADISAGANSIGFFMDGVDPASRKTYNVVWSYMRPMALFQNIGDALLEMESKMNVKITQYCANSDVDALLQNIEIYADQGVDGFIIVIDAATNMRIKEVLDSTGIPYIGILNSVRDENGSSIVPLIGMEGFTIGEQMVDWLYSNYKNYWGEIDTSKIGLLDFDFSPNIDFHERHEAAMAKFKALLPGNAGVFPADGVAGGLNEETGYDLAAAIFAANPGVEYWFVPSCLELYAVAASRAAEDLGIDNKVLITTANSDVLSALWDSGYEGCFVSCIATAPLQYAAPALCGLVAMMDGKATAETLWSSIRKPTDLYTYFEMDVEILTKDTYKQFFERVKKDSGLG